MPLQLKVPLRLRVFEDLLKTLWPGDALFDFTGPAFLKEVRRLLTLLGCQTMKACTLKSFRAGRATSLAESGSGLADILAAGEWSSKAVLRYCHAEDLDLSAVVNVLSDYDTE